MASIEEKVENLIKKPINDLGYELYDVIYTKEGKDYFLRIYIDKDNGIDLNDCEKVNDAISDLLDEANYIKDQYFLEVSSPGIERIIRKNEQLEKNIGETIYVKLFKPLNNKKEYIVVMLFFLVGIFLGVFFVNNIQETQRMEISSYLTNFIEKMKTTENLNYMDLLKNSMGQNILLAIMIWFFGTTVIRDTSSFWNCIL